MLHRSAWRVIVALTLVALGAVSSRSLAQIRLEIDATDLPRRLLRATETIPAPASMRQEGGDLALWYPKWIPGTHAAGGPVKNIAGLRLFDQDGKPIEWTRTPGEVYRFVAHLPADVSEIVVKFEYVANQSTTNSHGVDAFGSERLGLINSNTVLLVPQGDRSDEIKVNMSLRLPEQWTAATALPVDGQHAGVIQYERTTLETLVDSPIMVGRHERVYELVDKGSSTPPHRLHVFSENASMVDIDDDVLAGFKRMVTQAARLFGRHPFDSFDLLLATTNQFPRNGLEHLRSSMNVIPLDTLTSPKKLKGWNRNLVPHEYTHAWDGKHRRPQGMVATNFYTPEDTRLLWVYEGLTEYIGELLQVRSGMMSDEEFRWLLEQRVRSLRLEQGRSWQPLGDTAAASGILRSGSRNWSNLRRGQDYYYEGALYWLEADAIIRRLTHDERSLDNFCKAFFGKEGKSPMGYDRAEIVRTLNDVAEYDWNGFWTLRIDEPHERLPMGVVTELGMSVQFTNEPPEGPDDARVNELDARDSIGVRFTSGGVISDVQIGSAGDKAGLGPGMKVVGVGGFVWSKDRFVEALKATPIKAKMDLLVAQGDALTPVVIEYDGGPRYLTLVRDEKKPDRLAKIMAPRDK